ncbi:YqfX [Niallia circulans]|jgi:hypothetical protein|uniref:DUF4190 domain-containing protein n=1 Tax=Niallia TaxID=2837506 RepID=UPI00077C966E|nr:DUF4190 domain-containing protein [Niallia circulans]MDR4314368.1 DUF4190 domain-containing protein [Niallia circulans]MED3839452.1 DUF4190 domain-containing protein [Niallia circulans]MED4242524.1 DUF4190 domain-containing protein [Niallia circulans]MED4246502.1 DUF4190 domain-containing protein [Niallia circulans]MED5102352.1 DUF4190 domain-containing protein [Niallia circulans]
MADQNSNEGYSHDFQDRERTKSPVDYLEETSAEITPPMTYNATPPMTSADTRPVTSDVEGDRGVVGGKGVGIAALVISILSLFVMPIILGIVGIVLGFVARSKGASSLGTWAIALGAISIIIGIFIAPFF